MAFIDVKPKGMLKKIKNKVKTSQITRPKGHTRI